MDGFWWNMPPARGPHTGFAKFEKNNRTRFEEVGKSGGLRPGFKRHPASG
jgi:hypothetical protein